MSRQSPQNGMTLLESLITMGIVSGLLLMAVPSMADFVMNNRMVSQANIFLGSMSLARTEAVRRGRPVSLCPSTDEASCNPGAWEQGWIVFVDEDGDGTRGAAETLLKVQQALAGNNTLRAEDAVLDGFIQFRSSGFAAGAAPFTRKALNLCDRRGTERGRTITLLATGRAGSNAPAEACP